MHSLRPIYNIYKHISTHTAHLSTGNSLWKTHLAPPPHPQRSTHRAPTTPPKKMLQLKKCSYGSPITPPGHTNTGFRDLRFKNQRPLVENTGLKEKPVYSQLHLDFDLENAFEQCLWFPQPEQPVDRTYREEPGTRYLPVSPIPLPP